MREIEKERRDRDDRLQLGEGFGFTVHMIIVGMVGLRELKNIQGIFC